MVVLYHQVSVQGILQTVHCQMRAFCTLYAARWGNSADCTLPAQSILQTVHRQMRAFCRLYTASPEYSANCTPPRQGHSAYYTHRSGHSANSTATFQGILQTVHCQDWAFCKLYTAKVRTFCKLYTAKLRAFCRLYTASPEHSANCTLPDEGILQTVHCQSRAFCKLYTTKARAFCILHSQARAFFELCSHISGHSADCTLPGQGILQTVHRQGQDFCKLYTTKVRAFCRLHLPVRAFSELYIHISGHSTDCQTRAFCRLHRQGQGIL